MTRLSSRILTAMATVALMAVPIPAESLDLGKTVKSVSKTVSKATGSLGGALSGGGSGGISSSSSGTSASVSSGAGGGLKAGVKSSLLGGTNLEVKLLDQTGVASVGASNDGTGTKASAGVLSRGQLLSLGLDPDTSIGGGGSIGGGSGGITPNYARALLADMNRLEAQALKLKCRDVLRSPKAFDAELILLCTIVASL